MFPCGGTTRTFREVRHYLERESERVRISENAYRVLANYYRNGAFVSSFAGLLERIGLLGSQTMASLAVASKASS